MDGLTIRPQESTQAAKVSYSLPNLHGDVLLTTNGVGQNTSTGNGPASSFTYDPFGSILAGSTFPSNTAGGSYAYVGQHQKLSETVFGLAPIQMGVRVYLPTLGRFAQVDPVEGGTENGYVYPADPVNEFDLDGTFSMPGQYVASPTIAFSVDCRNNGLAACSGHMALIGAGALALAYAPAAISFAATRAAGLAWAPGTAGSGLANLTKHFAKHGTSMGYRSPATYTVGAAKNVFRALGKSVRQSSGARAFVSAAAKRVTLTFGPRITSYFKAKSLNRWK